jgi:hypothetical protein
MVFPHRACGLPQALLPFRCTDGTFSEKVSPRHDWEVTNKVTAGLNPADPAALGHEVAASCMHSSAASWSFAVNCSTSATMPGSAVSPKYASPL